MPWKVDWRVLVNGQDMSGEMARFLTSISVTDQAGTESDRCSLAFDDRDAQLRLPGDRSAVAVYLQGVQVFNGIVDSVRSSGSRGSGRAINVTAKGYDVKGKAKEPQSFHSDDASLKDFLGKAAEAAGFSLKIDDELGAITRDYWAADGESFVHLGERLAREFYATFKLRGTEAVFVPRGSDPGLPAIIGTVGREFNGNVISWDIAPLTGRRQFTKAEVRWFDRESASFKTKEVEFSTDRDLPDSANKIRTTAADEAQAGDVGEARKSEAEREGGEGSVDLDLAVEAQAEAQFILTGARPGVDGTYRIVSVTHTANRSSGATTSLQLKQPAGGAGTDRR
ncbi:phage late control D family protein [Oricola indica]|jgi:phage protein D|uniref:phage late control D family protein n=1 Tax=Oricola indica TaxID=2872591 RepID=UPI001CBD6532|nr:late control D family protein [Oricola indica]